MSDEKLAELNERLAPPAQFRVKGVPVWYGSDDDAWEEFSKQLKK